MENTKRMCRENVNKFAWFRPPPIPHCLGYYRPNVHVCAPFTHVNFILRFEFFLFKTVMENSRKVLFSV